MEKSDINTIESYIFDGKNTQYGAYQLRRKTNMNMIKGLLIGMGFLAIAYAVPLIIDFLTKEEQEMRQTEAQVTPFSELTAPPPIPPEPKPPEPVKEPPKVATQKFVRPELKPDEEVIDEELIPTITELKIANPGRETREGAGDIHADYTPKVVIEEPEEPAPPPKEEVYSYVEQFPEFPGGERAMQEYISKNIRYPGAALNAGIEGVVVVQFVVGRDGKIINPKVVRDIGGGCGEEALRIIESMPTWIPGEQNGRPVSVKYTLPIRFKMLN